MMAGTVGRRLTTSKTFELTSASLATQNRIRMVAVVDFFYEMDGVLQQLEGQPWPAQFAVKGGPFRLRPAILGCDRRRRVEPALRASSVRFRQRSGRPARGHRMGFGWPSRSPGGWRRSCNGTCRLRIASARHGSCAWVISVKELRSAPSGKGAIHELRRRDPSYPSQAGRDNAVWLVAIRLARAAI